MSAKETVEVPLWAVKTLGVVGALGVAVLTYFSQSWAEDIKKGLAGVGADVKSLTATVTGNYQMLGSQISGESAERKAADGDLSERIAKLETKNKLEADARALKVMQDLRKRRR